MNTINLLPPWAKKAKAQRRLTKIFAAIQIAVIFVLFAAWLALNALTEQAWARSREISQRIDALDSAPAEMAEALQTARAEAIYIYAFLEIQPAYLDAEALDLIVAATPSNTTLLRLDYAAQIFLLTATAYDINIIEQHRANLTEFFYVTSGHITRTNGVYVYEMRVWR